MSRGVRLLLVFLLLMGVIMLMMDCAKKSMKKKKLHNEMTPASQGWLPPTPTEPKLRLTFEAQDRTSWSS